MYTGGGAALRFSALRAGDRRDAINSLRAGELPSMLRGSERRQVGRARRKVFDLKKKKKSMLAHVFALQSIMRRS